MAKFYGSVGYAETLQTAPGVHEEQIVEYPYYGDLTRNARQLQSGESLNDDINVANEIETVHADNAPYRLLDRYQVTVIYKNPDSDLPHRLAMLPMCTHDRHFTADNLNHDIFNLYY